MNDDGLTEGTGTWVETVGPNIEYQFDASTMPHVLIRQSDGTFDFQEAEWGDRVAGDLETAENPSFVDNKIQDITLFKNRLGFLSRDKLILSRSGKFFEFFPETVTTFLDGNPIDIATVGTSVNFLKNAIAYNEQLLLFSSEAQFIIPKSDILSAKTISIDLTTSFGNKTDVKPVGIGNSVFFATETTNYTNVLEYKVTENSTTNDALDITAHVPQYIPKNATKFATIGKEHLFVITEDEPNCIDFYKFYINGQQKLQSAWQKWTFDSDCTILNIDAIGEDLFIVAQYTDGVYLEKINISFENDANETYITHLDRRVTDADCTVVYDLGTNRTTFTLPYQVTGDMEVVTRYGGSIPSGVVLSQYSASGTDIVVTGDYSSQEVYIGTYYTKTYEPSQFFVTTQRSDRSETLVSDGRLQIKTYRVRYENTGYFRIEVTPNLRDTSVKEFTGKIVNSGNNLIDGVALESGELQTLVQSKNDQVSIKLINDSFLPSNFITAEWKGEINPKGRGV